MSALVLGTLVGGILSVVVTLQFFLFLEFPFEFTFPTILLVIMYVMALITTYVAVKSPVTDINKK